MCTVQGNLKDVEISRSITSALLLVLYKDGIPGESSLLTDNLNLTARLSNVRIIQILQLCKWTHAVRVQDCFTNTFRISRNSSQCYLTEMSCTYLL